MAETATIERLQARIQELEAREKAWQTEADLNRALSDSAAALLKTLDSQAVLRRILENVGRVVPHDTANIMLIEGDVAYMRYWRGYTESEIEIFRNFPFKIDEFATFRFMLKQQQPIAIPDTHQSEGWTHSELNERLRSYAAAPIKLEDRVIGFLNLDSNKPNTLDQQQAERLQSFADYAAIALHNAQLYEQSRQQAADLKRQMAVLHSAEHALARRNQLLEALNEIARAGLVYLEESRILDTVARLAAEVFDATSAYICDWHPEDMTTSVLADYFSPAANELERISDRGQTYTVVDESGESPDWLANLGAYLIDTLDNPESKMNPSKREHIQAYKGYAVLTVPLHVDDTIIGYLEVWDSRPPRRFDLQDVEAAQAIARQMALTLDKARLHSALKQSETRNAAMLNAIPDTMFRLDRQGRYLDAKFAPGSHVTREDVLGRSLRDTMPSEVASMGLDYVRRALKSNQMEIYEYQLPAQDGFRDFEARLVVAGADEVIAIIRDITERKQAEFALAQARDEALAASQIKSQFLANISHELRTPLNAILNYTQLLTDGIYGDISRTQRDRMEKVLRSAQHLLSLVNDVLDLSKIESGHMAIIPRRVNTIELLANLIETFRPMAERSGLTLEYIGGNLPDLLADETRVRQVFNNILANAIKFTEQGGITIITETEIYADGRELLRFSIADTGIGIPQEALDLIFEEFRQVDNSSTRRYDGTGLGLAISKKIVEMHGGHIEVSSTPEKGSIFHVSLPIAGR